MAYTAPQGTELIAPIGRGSVFDVALVREVGREPERALVCKRLRPRVLRELAGQVAIAREAQFLALARHPSLPRLQRVGADDAGPFVLETRAEGASASALAEGWLRRGAGVPPRLFAHLAHAAATALAEIHALADARGPLALVHGDLGPDHVLMGTLGDVRFVDFGAARFRDMDARLDAGDRGTLPFVAPEVARGEEAPGQAGDVYALSATLLFLASGAPLVDARDEASMLLVIGERGLDPARIDRAAALGPRAREALRRALAFDPRERIRTAEALVDALE